MKKDFSENEFCCKDEAEAQEGVVMQQSCRRVQFGCIRVTCRRVGIFIFAVWSPRLCSWRLVKLRPFLGIVLWSNEY